MQSTVCSASMLHACTRVYAEQRPAAPSGHAQPSGRICSQSINPSITLSLMQDAILPSPQFCSSSSSNSERSIKHLVSSRLACDQELDSIDCQQIINRRRGRVASSAAPSPTLSHHQNCRSSVRSCRPSHLTDTPHLFDWAISVSSYDSYHPPPSLMTSSACRPPL